MELNIHNVRFYEFEPQAINCIVYNKDLKLLALSRSDNRIEVWNCHHKPFKQFEFIGSKVGSIEALAWCNQTLFSAGQYDFVLEYDPESFKIKRQTAVIGGVTWCLALSPDKKLLAAGTEQGILCLFNIDEEGLQIYKTFPRQEARIFCINWHPNGEYLVTGSIDFIQLRHIEKEHVLQFPVGRAAKSQSTIIWCVNLLTDMTIVTGDSRGKTCFWNGQFGTLISDVQTHKADVLTMCITANEKSVHVAGIDPVIVEVQLADRGLNKEKRQMWVKSIHRRIHTHDIRAMALTEEEKLFTGGVDTYLTLSYYPPKTAIKFPATPHRGCISVTKKSRKILFGYENRVELWQLGTSDVSDDIAGRYLPLKEDRVKLVELLLKEKERLQSCAVSPEGTKIAYITNGNIRIYQYTLPTNYEEAKLLKISVPKRDSAAQLLWLDEVNLLVSTLTGILEILSADESEAKVTKTLKLPNSHCCLLMSSSVDGKYIVFVDTTNTTWVYNCNKEEFRSLPNLKVPITAMAINTQNELFMVHSNSCMVEFDLHDHAYTQFGRRLINNTNSDFVKCNYTINNISFEGNNKIFLHTCSNFIVIDKHAINNSNFSPKNNKIAKFDSYTDSENSNCSVRTSTNGDFSFIERTNHILHFENIDSNNFASVELNPILLLDSLPPALKIKKFGAM